MTRHERRRPNRGPASQESGQELTPEGTPQRLFGDEPEPEREPWTHRLHGITEDKRDGHRVALSALNVGVREKLERAIARRAATGEPFTSDDLHDDLDADVLPHDGASMGALVNAAARSGLIEECGYVKSRRPEARSRRIVQWVGAEVGR